MTASATPMPVAYGTLGENVEFFSKRRAAAAARVVCVGKRYASGGAAPTRGVSFSNDCAPDTRSASRRPKPARASIVPEGTGHGWTTQSFPKLSSTAEAASSSSYSPSLEYPRANAARPIWSAMGVPAGRAAASLLSSPSVSGAIRRRMVEPNHVRWILQPARPRKSLELFSGAPTKTQYNTPPTRCRTQRPGDITPTTRHREPRQPDTRAAPS